MKDNNGWTEWKPQVRGRATKYIDQMKIIVSGGAKSKTRRIYLSNAVLKALGNSEYIRVFTRGNNIGFCASEDQEGFKIALQAKSTMYSIDATRIVKAYSLHPGVYDVYNQDGVIVLDAMQKPAQL